MSTSGSVFQIAATSCSVMSCCPRPETFAIQADIESWTAPSCSGMFFHGSGGATIGIITARWGLLRCAGKSCVQPRYDPPVVPTFPLDQGCVPHHVCAS